MRQIAARVVPPSDLRGLAGVGKGDNGEKKTAAVRALGVGAGRTGCVRSVATNGSLGRRAASQDALSTATNSKVARSGFSFIVGLLSADYSDHMPLQPYRLSASRAGSAVGRR